MNYKDTKTGEEFELGAIECNGYHTFVKYEQEGESGIDFYSDSPEDADKVLYDVSYMICFADCCDISVNRIVIQGYEVEYAGWQPDMLFEYIDKETGESIWSRHFSRWNH